MDDTPLAYPAAVTDEQLWRSVGAELGKIRLRAGHTSTHAMYRAGGPATGTIDDIEAGRVGNLDRVSAYCTALNVTLGAVLKTVLDDADGVRLSADARWVAEMFQEGPDEDGRRGMLALAKSQAAQRAANFAASPVTPLGRLATGDGSRAPKRTVRGRR